MQSKNLLGKCRQNNDIMRQTPKQLMARKSSLHVGLKEGLQVEKKDPDIHLNLQERRKIP